MKKWTVLLLPLSLATLACSIVAAGDPPPRIIFISENTPARTAMEEFVLSEHNAGIIENIRVTDFPLWEAEMAKPTAERFADYIAAAFRNIPASIRNARYAEVQAALGLADTDPADKGFTDLLEAAGYDVYRSWTERESDPITGATTATHEFHGEIGEPFSATEDHRLSADQVARLGAADLIIVSRNITPNRYSWAGREAGQPATALIRQWNDLPVPIIVMDPILAGTNEFGSYGWGLHYGFFGNWSTIAPFDRRAVPADQRFVFPDLRPAVRQSDPELLTGVELADGNRVALYKDYSQFPFLSQTVRKFSNNKNYVFPANAKVVLELLFPTFVDILAGEIEHQNLIMIEYQKGIPGFSPQDGIPVPERVGTPAETRLFFAAGLTAFGLYNLGEAGERVFLNAVAKYAGGGSIEPPPGPLVPGAWLVTDIGWVYGATEYWGYSPLMGFVHMGSLPWVYQVPLGWIHITDAGPDGAGRIAWWMYSESLGWIHLSNRDGGRFQHANTSPPWGWNNFLNPNP